MWQSAVGLLLVCLVGAPADAGRHATSGHPAWLLGADGTLLGTLPAGETRRFAPAHERAYEVRDGVLQAFPLKAGTKTPVWSVPCVVSSAGVPVLLQQGPDVLVVTADRIRRFAGVTGARQYDVPTDGYGLRGESQYGQVDWLGSLGEVAYLARSKVRHVRAPDGTWLGSEVVTRPTVRAMDTRTGKSLLTFEPLLDSHRSLIGDVTRGMCVTRGREIGVSAFCRRGQVAAFFHPKSGARQGEMARVRDVARRGSEPDAGVSDDVQFVLLDTTPPRLRAVNVSSGHVVWTSKGLLGAVAVAAVGTSLVVVDATTRALVVHRGTGSVVATLPQPETNHRYLAMRAWIQSRHIITWTPLQDVNYVAAWDTKMYRRVWHVYDADVQFVSNAHVALVANNFANGHRPPIADAETWQSRGPTLTMHDLQSGAQMWTWQPPLPSTEVVTSVRMEARQIGARVAVRMVWIGR